MSTFQGGGAAPTRERLPIIGGRRSGTLMLDDARLSQRLILLAVVGALLLNFPVLAIFASQHVLLAGVPALYVYLFVVWAAIIVGVWLLAGRRHDDDREA
jgi:hypothetical protein